MSKIEEVARAIEEKLSELTLGDYTLDYPVNDQGTAAEFVARAALLAIREPDEGMIGEFKAECAGDADEPSEERVSQAWQAAIDHALTQENG